MRDLAHPADFQGFPFKLLSLSRSCKVAVASSLLSIGGFVGIMARRDQTIVRTGSKKGSRWLISDKDTKPEKYPKKP